MRCLPKTQFPAGKRRAGWGRFSVTGAACLVQAGEAALLSGLNTPPDRHSPLEMRCLIFRHAPQSQQARGLGGL